MEEVEKVLIMDSYWPASTAPLARTEPPSTFFLSGTGQDQTLLY